MHVIITVNIIWKKLNEKIIENPYNLKCARVVEIQNTKKQGWFDIRNALRN